MKKLFFILTILVLFSCNKAKESMQDTVNEALEKAIESNTGTQVDLPDADEMDNNGGFISYKSGTNVYLESKEKMQATIIFQKNNEGLSIALQLVGENGKSFMATLNHVSEDFSLPLSGKFAVSNHYDGTNPVATALFMNVTENGMMSSPMPFEGALKITKLSKTIVEFEIDGRGGNASDAESPSNWETISGSGKLTHPIIMSYGIDKNSVLK